MPLPPLPSGALPLSGLRVLDLTRILAGPVGGRALAAYGADVLMINAPHLPNIEAIAVTSRGKLSALADLRESAGRVALNGLLEQAHVMVQGYRPAGLRDLGFGPDAVAQCRPGVVYVSLSAYGADGPWPWAYWLRGLGRVAGGLQADKPDHSPYRETSASGFGVLQSLRHSAQLSRTPARWARPSMPPGSHPAQWP